MSATIITVICKDIIQVATSKEILVFARGTIHTQWKAAKSIVTASLLFTDHNNGWLVSNQDTCHAATAAAADEYGEEGTNIDSNEGTKWEPVEHRVTAIFTRARTGIALTTVHVSIPVSKHPPAANNHPSKQKQWDKQLAAPSTSISYAGLCILILSMVSFSACLNASSHPIDYRLKECKDPKHKEPDWDFISSFAIMKIDSSCRY